MDKLSQAIALAEHIVSMGDDAYLTGDPEWNEIVKEAKEFLSDTPASYALYSSEKPGFLCCDGNGDYVVSMEYEEGQKYEGMVKIFASIPEAMIFIEQCNYWALSPVEFSR